jgi:hypothetical protein
MIGTAGRLVEHFYNLALCLFTHPSGTSRLLACRNPAGLEGFRHCGLNAAFQIRSRLSGGN